MKPVCIIPARKGSKRIKNKNIKLFLGKPLISYTIKIAKKSKLFSRIIVSTDSKKIARIAKNNGADVPFIRNKKISNDYATSIEVLLDCIHKIKSKNIKYHFLLYPGAVLINKNDLVKAYQIIKKKKAQRLAVMTNYNVSPEGACKIIKNNFINFNWPKHNTINSKRKKRLVKSSKIIHDTGSFYIYETKALLTAEKKKVANSYYFISKKKTTYYLLHRLKSVDINTMEDFKFAEFLYKFNLK